MASTSMSADLAKDPRGRPGSDNCHLLSPWIALDYASFHLAESKILSTKATNHQKRPTSRVMWLVRFVIQFGVPGSKMVAIVECKGDPSAGVYTCGL